MSESTDEFIKAEAAGFTWVRRAPLPEDDHVLGHTLNWLNALPEGIRPVHLQDAFPRIANDVSRLWEESAALDRYFEEKEFSPREDRRGFPPVIKDELLAMHLYSLRTRQVSYEQRSAQRARLLG